MFFEYDVTLLAKNNEGGLDIFDFLKSCGYETVLFYDNFGRFVTSTSLSNTKTINQLHRYCKGNKGAFAFFDIMAFHATDNKLAELFILSEENNP